MTAAAVKRLLDKARAEYESAGYGTREAQVLYYTILYYTILYSARLCCALCWLCCAVLCCAVLCCAMLGCYTIHILWYVRLPLHDYHTLTTAYGMRAAQSFGQDGRGGGGDGRCLPCKCYATKEAKALAAGERVQHPLTSAHTDQGTLANTQRRRLSL